MTTGFNKQQAKAIVTEALAVWGDAPVGRMIKLFTVSDHILHALATQMTDSISVEVIRDLWRMALADKRLAE